MRWYAGIDPGLDGAIAVLGDGRLQVSSADIYDAPSAKIGNKSDFMVADMVNILQRYPGEVLAAIERVHSMPKQGVASSFNFGRGVGYWIGILAALKIPYEEVTPQRWQADMLNGIQKTKDASRLRAMQLFPQLADKLNLKKHHGRADALLIASWIQRQKL